MIEHGPQHLLTILLLVPLVGTFIIGLSPVESARTLARVLGFVMLGVSAMLTANFDISHHGLQFVEKISWIRYPIPVEYHVGIDGMSLALVLLTTFTTLMAIFASSSMDAKRPKLYYSMLMLLTTSVLAVFTACDIIQFFVAFELELIPMYLLIAIWGGPNRDYAAMKFLIYTFFGGICMLAGLLYMLFHMAQMIPSTDMTQLAVLCPSLPLAVQLIACTGFGIAFLIKLPSFPFHTWLPDAHVEAPTPISMILAGVLLKMGSYGLVRICLGFFPDAIIALSSFLIALGAFNIIWAAIACLVQQDMKRIIAFSSVSHMGFITLGIGALSAAALSGAIFQMISHGVISAALFFLVGVVYERTHTRSLPEIGGGLASQMRMAFYFWMFAALANLGLPGLSGFVAETATLYGAIVGPVAAHLWPRIFIAIACSGVILTAGYMLWLLKRLFYGEENPKWVGHLTDMRPTEVFVASALTVSILVLGVYPLCLSRLYTPVADNMVGTITARRPIAMSNNYKKAAASKSL